jgi:hypothetical protein
MKRLILASALAIAAALPASAAEPNMKLTQAQCDTIWKQANPTNASTITEAQAQAFVSDVKTANPDGDGTLDKAEFSKACSMGLVKSAASGSSGSTGSGAGESGSTAPGAQ